MFDCGQPSEEALKSGFSPSACTLKQVEFNTMASSFGGLCTQLSKFHRYSLNLILLGYVILGISCGFLVHRILNINCRMVFQEIKCCGMDEIEFHVSIIKYIIFLNNTYYIR